MAKKISNPFITVGYKGQEYFCDREKETKKLIDNAKNGNHTSLISIRRIGKTGLIHHVLDKMDKNWFVIYVDIEDTENMNQFFNKIISSAIQAIPEKTNPGKKLWKFLKSLRAVLKFDPLTGNPNISIDLKPDDTKIGIESLLRILDDLNSHVLIAIDEFQEILKYPEKKTDSWLKSKIQSLKNVYFIFSGSKQHLMQDMFTSPDKPFFRSTQLLVLKKLDINTYSNFVNKMFEKHSKTIEKETAKNIIKWANVHTFYVQQLLNRVFSASTKKVSGDLWKKQAYILLKEQEQIFFSYRNLLTKIQWNLLKAIAHEDKVYNITAGDFIKKHNLSSSSGVIRAVNSLLKSEMIYYDLDENGNKFYSVYDVFFQQWVAEKYR